MKEKPSADKTYIFFSFNNKFLSFLFLCFIRNALAMWFSNICVIHIFFSFSIYILWSSVSAILYATLFSNYLRTILDVFGCYLNDWRINDSTNAIIYFLSLNFTNLNVTYFKAEYVFIGKGNLLIPSNRIKKTNERMQFYRFKLSLLTTSCRINVYTIWNAFEVLQANPQFKHSHSQFKESDE